MLWEVDIYAAEGQPDLGARDVTAAAAELHLTNDLAVTSARGYLIQGDLDQGQVARIADELLADRVVERTVVEPVGDALLTELPSGRAHWIHVLLKPGVMDPVALSAMDAIADLGIQVEAVRTLKKFAVGRLADDRLALLCSKVLANDAIEQVIVGPLSFQRLEVGSSYRFNRVTEPIDELDDAELMDLSLKGQLYLSLVEMQTIQAHFRTLGHDPTDVELETVAQTWSEHCSHKTLAGQIHYRGPDGEHDFKNMLKETIFAATEKIREKLRNAQAATPANDSSDDAMAAKGRQLPQPPKDWVVHVPSDGSTEVPGYQRTLVPDWCVSVFSDNAGVINFDDEYDIVFKVETHNHPSALEPYGGANTGIGGVIRDPMGTGMGAKPICNTDVFCFAPPDTPTESLPPGVLHPRRVMKGVVSGVRDYGNRMGIPTVNGAIYFDPRYLGNPLVYCGNVGLIPHKMAVDHPRPDDLIVVIGGRTGRDGIHGATFSSAELTSQSETISGGAVQIGNAITEKMVLDVLLAARNLGLYNAVTDCGAGGLSSAVGEMGEKIGAKVWLDRVPLKYEGLSYTEIWISESQERMVLSVPRKNWNRLRELCESEGVEATHIGQFVQTERLVLKYKNNEVADLPMRFLHDGLPPVVRDAVYTPPSPLALREGARATLFGELYASPAIKERLGQRDYTRTALKILGSLNVCSKEWVIRQYDHEVQGGSVIKPLVGLMNDGPSDAAVIRPVLGSRRGLIISCGMNPRYADFDTYWMAASAIDEAVRNCVAVGADPNRIAILDNFCWGATDRPETLGSLVRAALACHDVAIALGTPFISGKDSLNNEFRPLGAKEPISIPPSLLISALGQVDDVAHCVSMDLKESGNLLYLVGLTKNELGGSHFALVEGLSGGEAPKVDAELARQTFAAIHRAIHSGLVRACHDLSEGGLAVAAAEMAFAGGLGARVVLADVPCDGSLSPAAKLFSESNTRFLCEIRPTSAAAFEAALSGIPHARIGNATAGGRLEILAGSDTVVSADISTLKEAWQKPLRW